MVVLDFCDSVYFHTLSWLCIPSWDMNDGPVSGGMNVSVPSIISIPVLKGCSQGGRCCMLPLFPTNVMHGEVVYLSYYSVTTKYLSASDYNIPNVLHPENVKTWNPCRIIWISNQEWCFWLLQYIRIIIECFKWNSLKINHNTHIITYTSDTSTWNRNINNSP